MLRLLLMLSIFAHCVFYSTANYEGAKTLYGEKKVSSGKTMLLNVDSDPLQVDEEHIRYRRDTPQPVATNSTIITKITHLNDTHKQMMVHWVGEGSNVVICLSKDPTPPGLLGMVQPSTPSSVFISYDYGDTYENKTELFKLPNGSYAILDKFYNHPKYNTHFVFTDLRNRIIHVTSDHGRTFKSHSVHFSPSEIAFHEYLPLVFAVLDKEDPNRSLWITENFGETFRRVQMFVKSFLWLDDGEDYLKLIVQRIEPNGLNTIGYSSFEDISKETIYDTNVKDFYVKENYLFTTKIGRNGKLELYFSYKLKKKLKCVFNSELNAKSYYIVDVSANRALVAVSHKDTLSHLYVSDDLNGENDQVHFTLSLEAVFSFFPNSTWNESFLSHVSEEAFADVYKVEPIDGIYIASQVISQPQGHNIGPQHIASLITFDHGASWRKIEAPQYDNEGQPTGCDSRSNCSLHLSQKFMYYYPDARAVGILSTKSAPGLIIATGVMGRNLKGHYGVYVSSDAGVTWHQALKELYFFNMGDHGGILTAVKYFHGNAKTRYLLYSTDEGENWSEVPFYKEEIRLYGLMTEPGENTTVFTMFGSAPAVHQWIIIKVDLRGVFSYNCSKNDYKTWSPGQDEENRSYIPCVMGQQLTYERRMPHSNCYNGLNYDIPVSMKPCSCDALDFECDFGFMRFGNPSYCIRNKSMNYDPYEIPRTCKPGGFYNRTKGYRKIAGDVCEDGFEKHYLPDVLPCPFKEVPHFLLFAHRDKISRFDLITKQVEDLPIVDLKNVIALDFDMKNNCVYWADIVLDTINRQCLNNGSKQEILVSNDLASVEGLAYDWISRNLYFVDGTRAKIEMIRTDINQWGRMRRTILDQKQLKKPRGIALHPASGYMFWSDWNSESPSISRANLDGTNIKILFGKSVVEWPNGITVDYIAERIYWVDGKRDYIASSDLHGNRFKIIISKHNVVSHPFAIAVFKDLMYWDDWKNNAIYDADKDLVTVTNQIETLFYTQQPGLMDLKVYAHSLQEGSNNCTNSPCPFICVGKPHGHRCLCPDGMNEAPTGKCVCPGGVEPFNMTCPKLGNTCNPEHTACANGACIPKGWRCDGEDDCGDNSDEMNCNSQPCEKNLHRCSDGKCIPHYWKCDFEKDCADGSDEMNCPKHNCTSEQFACRNGRCISSRWKCDRENDCADGSDEEGCEIAEPKECKIGEFACTTGGVKCIPSTWKCDGESDCRDNSDELNCQNNTCLDTQFSCGPPTNRCIHKTWVCDGDLDCKSGKDEENCSTTAKPATTAKPSFDSTNGTCHSWMFTCANKKCIPNWWRCDSADDCGDNSDELDCPTNSFPLPHDNKSPGVSVCSDNHYQCNTGECINESWVCDGQKDCPNGDDELNCGGVTKCTTMEYKCRIDSSCIPLHNVCNFVNDCPDGSDEASCERDQNVPAPDPATPSCLRGYYPCDVNSCYPLVTLCDGKHECLDGFDEANCSSHTHRIYQVLQMGIEDLGITEHSLRLYWWIATPRNESLEFLPTISVAGENKWRNDTWIENSEHVYENLEPYTWYNMTVYVRVKGTDEAFPPAKYFMAKTKEGIPGAPLNLTVQQQNGSHVLLSWQPPAVANGPISYYEICYSPPYPPIKVDLNDNGTAHLLTVDFEPGESYSFYVVAHNRLHEGEKSDVKTIEYDKDLAVTRIINLAAIDSSNNSISLKWDYHKAVDYFKVSISAERPYPMLPDQISHEKTYNVTGLAPGVTYTIAVSAVLKTLTGPESYVSTSTLGAALPEIGTPETMVIKDVGTSVKLSWNPLKDIRKRSVQWIYGIYYGLNEDELLERSKLNTTDFTATVTNLYACENYLFGVGVVGPYGIGPVSHIPANVRTYANRKAPPKDLIVETDKKNDLVIIVRWSPSCASSKDVLDYLITVYERVTKKTMNILQQNCTGPVCTHTFVITYGGIYDIKIKTGVEGAKYSSVFTYTAPPVLPPVEISVSPKANGTYIVSWKERNYKKEIGDYIYEVLVSEGPFNESTAEVYRVKVPPFIYSNASSNNYTFALRVKTNLGYQSSLSPRYSAIVLQEKRSSSTQNSSLSSTNLTAILVPTFLLIIVLSVILVVVIIRHQRLQNNFTRFANSHYDSRSGAATFDDHSLEEEEAPRITGFSDDEPLVIA